jgi:DnaJ-class molecular chaperone
MNLQTNLYVILGIDRTATPEEIKLAYRKRAKQTHPDHGGSSKEFADVNRANQVLSDPKSRSRYDRTGTVDDEPDNAMSAPVGILWGLLQNVVAQHAAGQGADPCTVDLVDALRKHLVQKIADMRRQAKESKQAAERIVKILRRVEVRLKQKPKAKNADFLKKSILWQIASIERAMETNQGNVTAHEDALKILDDYEFDPEQAAQNPYLFTAGFANWGKVDTP